MFDLKILSWIKTLYKNRTDKINAFIFIFMFHYSTDREIELNWIKQGFITIHENFTFVAELFERAQNK